MNIYKYKWKDENEKILKRLVSEDEEEILSKKRAKELFDEKILEVIEVGSFDGLREIHRFLFQDCYGTAGKVRTVNMAKGNFRFAPVMYLQAALESIENMQQSTFDEIIEKYVEMNMMHPFYEGNGRATRIWLDQILIKRLKVCVN